MMRKAEAEQHNIGKLPFVRGASCSTLLPQSSENKNLVPFMQLRNATLKGLHVLPPVQALKNQGLEGLTR